MLGNCCDRPEIDRYHCPMVERVIDTSLSELLVGIDFLDYATQKRRPKLLPPSESTKDRVFSQAPWPNRSSWVPCGNTSIRFGSFAARKTRRPISTRITPSCSPCRIRPAP